MYKIEIGHDDATVVLAYGNLDAVAYHGRKVALSDGVDYTLAITEHETIGGEPVRTVAEVTGDADIVQYVLAKRLRAEKARTATLAE